MKRLALFVPLLALAGAPALAKAAAEDASRQSSRSSGSFPYLHLIVTTVGIGWSVLIWRKAIPDRKGLAVHKDNPAFVLLGGDGGEQTFFVRRDPTDERVYVIDLELDWDFSKPRPYASDIAHWIVLRKQENTTE